MFQLSRKNTVGVSAAVFVYRAILLTVLLPVLNRTTILVLSIPGYSYITPRNILNMLIFPSTWLYGIFWVLVLATACFLEQAFMYHCYSLAEQNLVFRLRTFLVFVGHAFRKPVRRGLAGVFACVLVTEVFFCLSMLYLLSTRIRQITGIREFMHDHIYAVWGAGFLVVLLFLLAIRLAFILPYYAGENKSMTESFRSSGRLLHRNLRDFILRMLASVLVLNLISGAIYLILCILVLGGMRLFMAPAMALAHFHKLFDSLNTLAMFILGTWCACGLQKKIVHLFYRYKDARDELTSYQEEYGYDGTKADPKQAGMVWIVIGLAMAASILSIVSIVRDGMKDVGSFFEATEFTAHRGQSSEAPENTLPAVLLAIEASADYAEIDVRLTADGEVILMHDANCRRTCRVNRTVASMTLAEIKELDAGGWFSKAYQGTQVPTLREVIEEAKGKIKLNIEIKPQGGNVEELVDAVVSLVEEYDFVNQCVITSNIYDVMTAVKRRNDQIETGFIVSVVYGTFLDKEDIDFYSAKSDFVTEKTVDLIHERGRQIHVWTVDNRKELSRVQSLGVDNVITNKVLLAREVYQQAEDSTFPGILRTILAR